MKFYLGTHQPHWLWKTDVPLFISRRTLSKRKGLRQTQTTWALDSGGFSELSLFGRWTTPPAQYLDEVRQWSEEIGGLDWAACQDWMCEPWILEKTGKTIQEHQRLTLASFLLLRQSGLPFAPVLQGWELKDYLSHRRQYEAEGIDLSAEPVVGLGSVCRRQGMEEAAEIVREVSPGLRLHGFGFKLTGLKKVAHLLSSADSLAWSFGARREPALEGCVGHKNCANCIRYALLWNERVRKEIAKCEASFSSSSSWEQSLEPTGQLSSLAS